MNRIIIFLVFSIIGIMTIKCNLNAQKKITDNRDGQEYLTVKIGNQIWMAENLAFKADSGCFAYNNDENNVKQYGRLYTFETAINACPDGWRLPTKDEFETLIIKVGGKGNNRTSKAYYALIPGGKSNFNATLAGAYSINKVFVNQELKGSYWASDVNKNEYFDCSILDITPFKGASISTAQRSLGFSVRCISDQ